YVHAVRLVQQAEAELRREEGSEADRGSEPELTDPPSRHHGARPRLAPLCAILRHAAPSKRFIETRMTSNGRPAPTSVPGPPTPGPDAGLRVYGPEPRWYRRVWLSFGAGPGRLQAPVPPQNRPFGGVLSPQPQPEGACG